MQIPGSFISNSEFETSKIAEEFAGLIKNGDVVVLNGNLGAGKTFFIKSLLTVYGITDVSSPSFAIVNEYSGKIKVFHFDFFRLKGIEELLDIGWEDYISDSDAVIFIEWGNMLPEILPARRIEINISIINADKRKFEIKKYE